MPTPDELLIGWWILLAATSAGLTALVWQDRIQQRKAAVLTASQGGRSAYRGLSRKRSVTSWAVICFLLCLLLVCFIGFFIALWMAHWSALLVLNSFVLMIVFGAALLLFGVFSRRSWWMRTGSVAAGAVCAIIGAYIVIGDFLMMRLQVDGCVTRLAQYTSLSRRNFGDHFTITIGGSTYKTTHSVYSAVHQGDFVDAQMGAASKTIFAAEKSKESSPQANRCKST